MSVTVRPDSFLTLHYRLAGPQGDVVSTFGGNPATLSLGTGVLAPAVERRLVGVAEGAHVRFDLAPGEAFGERNPELLQWVARALLDGLSEPGQKWQVGEVVEFPTPDGRAGYAGTLREIGNESNADALLFDFNHPLAGQPVTFEAHVIGVL